MLERCVRTVGSADPMSCAISAGVRPAISRPSTRDFRRRKLEHRGDGLCGLSLTLAGRGDEQRRGRMQRDFIAQIAVS